LTITADNQSSAYGAALPTLTYSYSGLVNGDTGGVFSGALTTTATPTSDAGTYAITQGTLSAGSNYTITFTPGTLTIAAADTTTAETSSVNPSADGQSVMFTATVTAVAPGSGTPTGTVTFTDLGSSYTATLSAGVATWTTSALLAGTNPVSARYNGGTDFNSSSTPLPQTTTALVTLTAAPALAPTITSPGDQASAAGDVVALAVAASDPSNLPLTFGAVGLPGRLTIDPSTGIISGTIAASAAQAFGGQYQTTVSVWDAAGASTSSTFAWTVTDPAPTLQPVTAQQNRAGDLVSIPLLAMNPGGDALVYRASGLPEGLSVNPLTGAIVGRVGARDSGTYRVTASVSDWDHTTSTTFTWSVSPRIQVTLGDQQSTEGSSVVVQAQASTPDNTALSYSATNLPPGLSINATTGAITGTVAPGDATGGDNGAGLHAVTISATDGTYTGSTTSNWTIAPRIAVTLVNQQNIEGSSVAVQAQASTPDNTALTYSAPDLPNGLSIDLATGAISGAAATGDATAGDTGTGVYTVTISATDGTYTGSANVTWTIAPRITVTLANQQSLEGSSVSVQAQASTPDNTTLTFSATNLPPGLSINATTCAITGTVAVGDATGGDTGAGVYTVTISATDGTYTGTATVTWTIVSPITVALANQQNIEGDSVSVQAQANTPDNTPPTFSATNLPPGLSISASTGAITGTIAAGDATAGDNGAGAYAVTISATDGTYTGSTTSNWIIAPRITVAVTDQQNIEGDRVNVPIRATTPDDTALSFSASNLPPGLSINASTGVIGGTVSIGDAALGDDGAGDYAVAVWASAGGYTGTTMFNWAIAPRLTIDLADAQIREGDSVSAAVQVRTPDVATLHYGASDLPLGLSINPETGVISGTGAAGDATSGFDGAGDYAVEVTVTDGTYIATATALWTVSPRITVSLSDQQNLEGDGVSVPVQASSPDAGATLTYSITGLPNGLSINKTTGVITGTLAAGDATAGFDGLGDYQVEVTATDGTYTNSTTALWSVAPRITASLADQQNIEGNSVNVPVQVTTPDTGASLSYAATNLPAGLSINTSTGAITGTINAGDATAGDDGLGDYQVQVTVTEGAFTGTTTAVWSVSPRITVSLPDQQNIDGDNVNVAVSATTPDTGASLTYSATDLPSGLSINTATGAITGTIAAGDAAREMTAWVITRFR
jgi:hypothetical protein